MDKSFERVKKPSKIDLFRCDLRAQHKDLNWIRTVFQFRCRLSASLLHLFPKEKLKN